MTSNMVRKQVYLTREQDAQLKRLAQLRDVSEAELVREGIDRVLSEAQQRNSEAREAWQREEEFIGHLIVRTPSEIRGKGRDWTRDELYDRWESHGL